jgi:putative membrane protein
MCAFGLLGHGAKRLRVFECEFDTGTTGLARGQRNHAFPPDLLEQRISGRQVMEQTYDALLHALVSSIVFTTVGIGFFVIAFYAIQRMLPFSLRKEIEEDHNTAVAIILAAVIIGIAMIVSAAVHG